MRELAFEGDGFTVWRTIVGELDNNCYLIQDTATGTAMLIDAAEDASTLIEFVGDVPAEAVFTTHGHWDHHQAIPSVSDALGIPFMLHPLDTEIAGKIPDTETEAGPLQIGRTEAQVLHTPGHTPGSVCLLLPGVVLTGDTLFPGGPGATRFAHSSFDEIIESITSQLFTLDDSTVVLPGHGEATTIGTERPQLPDWVARGW